VASGRRRPAAVRSAERARVSHSAGPSGSDALDGGQPAAVDGLDETAVVALDAVRVAGRVLGERLVGALRRPEVRADRHAVAGP